RPGLVDECVVVGELNERPPPQRPHFVYLLKYAFDGLEAVARPIQLGGGAEVAIPGAAARRLNRDAVVWFQAVQLATRGGGSLGLIARGPRQQVKARQRGFAQIELARPRLAIERLQPPSAALTEVADHF